MGKDSTDKEQISEKKQIRFDVKERIKSGIPKQKIIEELSSLYKDKNSIIKEIESTPSNAMKSKYGLLNYMLASFLLAAVVIDVILCFRLDWSIFRSSGWSYWGIHINVILSLILDSVFLVGVIMYRINVYSWIASRALLTAIMLIASYAYIKDMFVIDYLVFVSFGLIVLSFVVGLMLCVKLCPPRVPKIIEKEIEGLNEKIKKTIYVYPD